MSAIRNLRPSRGISISTTWQMVRPVRRPFSASSTAFIRLGVAICPFIRRPGAAVPDLGDRDPGHVITLGALESHPIERDVQRLGDRPDAGLGPDQERPDPSPFHGDSQSLDHGWVIPAGHRDVHRLGTSVGPLEQIGEAGKLEHGEEIPDGRWQMADDR